MNLKQLEAFVQVAEGGSFSKAARELYLTQPTISAHISSLEKELNVRLFVRNTKEVSLSDNGKDLYKYAKQMVDLQGKIEEHFGMKKDSGKHCITIAASTIPAQYLLPKVLMCFNEKYPEEQFKIKETDSAQVVTQIVDCMADVGFTGTVLEKKHCKYIPFYKDELVIIAPNTEKYRRFQEECPNDISWLKREHVIMREEGSGTEKKPKNRLSGRQGVNMADLEIIASIENQETIKKSVRQGMGSLFCPGLPRQTRRKPGRCSYSIPGADEGRDINVVYNRNYQLSRSAERFIKIVKKKYMRYRKARDTGYRYFLYPVFDMYDNN